MHFHSKRGLNPDFIDQNCDGKMEFLHLITFKLICLNLSSNKSDHFICLFTHFTAE